MTVTWYPLDRAARFVRQRRILFGAVVGVLVAIFEIGAFAIATVHPQRGPKWPDYIVAGAFALMPLVALVFFRWMVRDQLDHQRVPARIGLEESGLTIEFESGPARSFTWQDPAFMMALYTNASASGARKVHSLNIGHIDIPIDPLVLDALVEAASQAGLVNDERSWRVSWPGGDQRLLTFHHPLGQSKFQRLHSAK